MARRDRGSTSISIPSCPWPSTWGSPSSVGRSSKPSNSRSNASATTGLVRSARGTLPWARRRGPSRPATRPSPTTNRPATARPLAGIFSPLRRGLRLDSHNVSTAIPGKIARVAARGGSFDDAAESLTDLAEITISGRQLGRIAHEVGEQLRDHRDRRAEDFQNRQAKPEVSVVPRLTTMSGDGGRLTTEDPQGEPPSRGAVGAVGEVPS